MKRKTTKEIRLEEYLDGFYTCLHMFEDEFRKHAWKEYRERKATGRSTFVKDSTCPITAALWSVIEKAQKQASPLGRELNELRTNRT
jgi:hypothetical protein